VVQHLNLFSMVEEPSYFQGLPIYELKSVDNSTLPNITYKGINYLDPTLTLQQFEAYPFTQGDMFRVLLTGTYDIAGVAVEMASELAVHYSSTEFFMLYGTYGTDNWLGFYGSESVPYNPDDYCVSYDVPQSSLVLAVISSGPNNLYYDNCITYHAACPSEVVYAHFSISCTNTIPSGWGSYYMGENNAVYLFGGTERKRKRKRKKKKEKERKRKRKRKRKEKRRIEQKIKTKRKEK
jgi:hypothetical protein